MEPFMPNQLLGEPLEQPHDLLVLPDDPQIGEVHRANSEAGDVSRPAVAPLDRRPSSPVSAAGCSHGNRCLYPPPRPA
jgi:hypothetical protein